MNGTRRWILSAALLAAGSSWGCGSSSANDAGSDGATPAPHDAGGLDATLDGNAKPDAATRTEDADTRDQASDDAADEAASATDARASSDDASDAPIDTPTDASTDAREDAAQDGDAGLVPTVGCVNSLYATIGAAIAAAAPGAEIDICAGTYAESLTITKSLTLVGISGSASTILDASGFQDGIAISSYVVSGDDAGADTLHTVSITGLTIRNAPYIGLSFVTNTSSTSLFSFALHDVQVLGCGQGINVTGCSIGIYDSAIEHNGSSTSTIDSLSGGGVYGKYAAFDIERTSISDNALSHTGVGNAVISGAGISVQNGSLALIDSTVENNSLTDTSGKSGANGAAISVYMTSTTISGSTVQGNTIDTSGAIQTSALEIVTPSVVVVAAFYGSLRVADSTFASNVVDEPITGGGVAFETALGVTATETDLSNVTFSMNSPSDFDNGRELVPITSPATLYCASSGAACTSICTSSCGSGMRCASPNACASGTCTNGACP